MVSAILPLGCIEILVRLDFVEEEKPSIRHDITIILIVIVT